MNNSDKAISEAINYMVELLKSGHDFVVSNAPEYIRQTISYGIWSNQALMLASIIISSVLFVVTVFFAIKDEDSTPMIFNLFQMLTIPCIFVSYATLMQIKLAPMVFIVEKLTSLVK